jgi:primosomal protein N''
LLRLPEKALETLKHLVNERDMYVIERAKLAGQLSRQERFMDKTLFQKKKEPLESILHELEQSMANIDKEIKE